MSQNAIKSDMQGCPEEQTRVIREYWWHMFKPGSDSEKSLPFSFAFGAFAKHPLTREDRLGNRDLDFPIGICYGEKDWLGSTGADEIIKNSKYFVAGHSQLFVIKNSDHVTFYDNPEDLCHVLIGFFNKTITHTFELKPRQTYIKQNERQAERNLLDPSKEYMKVEQSDSMLLDSDDSQQLVFFDKNELESYKNKR
jgi:hypothetical protein